MSQDSLLAKSIDRAQLNALDNQLSKRYIELDPGGYFLISLD
ncbi:MAG: DUF4346 domain-containing protein, partial [Leptolyngbyaceae cyanobacterium SM2_5_2]|nr:DUF4346 domain-containing protein [Leptolyngbyaceae cyanobacterium SM2_5_2]